MEEAKTWEAGDYPMLQKIQEFAVSVESKLKRSEGGWDLDCKTIWR